MNAEDKKVVAQLRKELDLKEDLSDEEVLAQARFVQGGGVKCFRSVEEYKAWKAEQK